MNTNLFGVEGEHTTGDDCRNQNVTAALAIANIVKTSLGPVGLDKMLVDDVGDTTVTNDGATILKLLEVEHPAGKILVELAQLQDKEVGDGTTTVVILAAELLRRAMELVRLKIHPTTIISGYRLAQKAACAHISDFLVTKMDKLSAEVQCKVLLQAAKTSLSSKILNTDIEFFAEMIVKATKHVKTPSGKYPIKNCNILKAHGLSATESQFIPGYALNCTRASQAMPLSVKNCKVALFDIDFRKVKLGLAMQVVTNDPKKLQGIQDREADITKERIQMILASGVNVLCTTKGIDDSAMKYFIDAGAIAVRRVAKDDMRRLSKATGAPIIMSLSNFEGDEKFDAKDAGLVGLCDEVAEERVGDNEMIVFKGCKNAEACSILLRGANSHALDEMERSVHDALCVVRRILESNDVVAGGGAVEAALSIFLENYAMSMSSKEQMAVAEFAQALVVIPKTLAVNAACDATELIARLRADHNKAQKDATCTTMKNHGLDLLQGNVRDNFEHGVIEPAISKIKSIQFATEAAITILRIDDTVKISPEENQ